MNQPTNHVYGDFERMFAVGVEFGEKRTQIVIGRSEFRHVVKTFLDHLKKSSSVCLSHMYRQIFSVPNYFREDQLRI